TGSTLKPITLQLRFLNSGSSFAIEPNSVVHTGVKSFGCENKTAQPSPIHSWKLIVPCVVSAVKFGASSLMRSDMFVLQTGCLLSRADYIALRFLARMWREDSAVTHAVVTYRWRSLRGPARISPRYVSSSARARQAGRLARLCVAHLRRCT